MNHRRIFMLLLLGLLLIAAIKPRKAPAPKIKAQPLVDVTIEPVVYLRNYIPLTRISAYNPVPRQTDSTPNISACGPNKPNQIAVSRDLLRKVIPCGTNVTLVTTRGEVFTNLVVWDTMNARYTQTADFMFDSTDESEAWNFGITSGYLILNPS